MSVEKYIVDAVPATAGAVVTITGPIQHMCPFREEVDDGTITIRWRTISSTIELHSLAGYLDGWSEAEISHEDLVDAITGELSRVGGIDLISVAASFTTAGLTVEARRE